MEFKGFGTFGLFHSRKEQFKYFNALLKILLKKGFKEDELVRLIKMTTTGETVYRLFFRSKTGIDFVNVKGGVNIITNLPEGFIKSILYKNPNEDRFNGLYIGGCDTERIIRWINPITNSQEQALATKIHFEEAKIVRALITAHKDGRISFDIKFISIPFVC